MENNFATVRQFVSEATSLSDDNKKGAQVYLLDIRITGTLLSPYCLLSGGGARSLSSTDFLKHEKFDAEQMSRVPDEVAFPNAEKSNLGDFAENRGALILSKKAAEVLERLEPGKHQIFPLKIESSKRYRPLLEAKGYVLVNVCQNIQAVSIEQSKLRQQILAPPAPYEKIVFHHISIETPDRLPHVVVDPTKVRSLHLWAGADKVLSQSLFVSKQLKEAWEAAGCGPMAYLPCKNI